MKKGKLVNLTTIERDDLETLRVWRNIEEFKKNFREYREISKEMQNNWFESLANDNKTIMFAIRDVKTNELLGCCGLCYINWVQRNADLSLYIGKEEAYIDEEIAKEACGLLFDYGFNQLGLRKIWTEIYDFDYKKYNFYVNKVGFHVDGELRDQYFYDGKWHNSYLLSLLSSDFIMV